MEAHFKTDFQAIMLDIKNITGWSNERIAREIGCSVHSIRRWKDEGLEPIEVYQREVMALYNRIKKEAKGN